MVVNGVGCGFCELLVKSVIVAAGLTPRYASWVSGVVEADGDEDSFGKAIGELELMGYSARVE